MKKIYIILLFSIFLLSACAINQVETKTQNESYTSCGCGCCGGEEPIQKCLFREKGDDLDKIIEEDKKSLENTDCNLVGCSLGTKYVYCD